MEDLLKQKKDFEQKNVDKSDEVNKQTKKQNKKQKNKFIRIGIIISILMLIILIFSTIFALINMGNENIVSGVKIEAIDVSGLSKDEAMSKIKLVYEEKKSKDIILKYGEYEANINPELIEANYEIEKAIDEAVSVGKNSNIIINNYNILFALMGKKDINVNITINEQSTQNTINDIEKNIPGAVQESNYYIEGENLIITKGKEGLKIDNSQLISKIKTVLEEISYDQEYIEIPVINKVPDTIDVEKIHKEVYKEVQDAYYTQDPFKIHPEVEGVDFNIEEAKALLESEDKEQYTIKLTITKPRVTTSQIGSEAFPDLLATYTTRYDATLVDRTTNLRIACQKINDKVVMPGEVFSYNQALGKRTPQAGYKNAKVYENGEVVDGIGGGICQISSTLYNAILMANMRATERRNHQFVTSYTPAGRDATVVYGLTDFKFKNTRDYAIKIKASISNGIATVSIYGVKSDKEYDVSFSTKTISNIPFTVKYIDDNNIPAGTEKVKQGGANGKITETYIIKSLNGVVVSRELLSKDTYSAMTKIILRGTKGADTTVNTEVTRPTTTVPTTPLEPQTPTETIPQPSIPDNSQQQEPVKPFEPESQPEQKPEQREDEETETDTEIIDNSINV